jgi:hypothetical protein
VGGLIRNGVDAQERPLAERWNGSAWRIRSTPNPQAENGSALTGVACTGAKACEAVGIYDYADVDQGVFAFGWDGTSWTQQDQPNPGGSDFNTEGSVSCSAASACGAVGTRVDGSGRIRALAERWNGTKWAQQQIPNHRGSAISETFGVSCAGATACSAVGDWSKSDTGQPGLTLAERWNGTGWAIQSTPNPPGATSSTLRGVACTSPSACVAVGGSYAASVSTTLVEVYTG